MIEMKLFTGPGQYLIVPYCWTDYPIDNCSICKRNAESNKPLILESSHGFFQELKVPFGTWWESGETPRIVRSWNIEEAEEWMDNND